MEKMKCPACGAESMMCQGCKMENVPADHSCPGAKCECTQCHAMTEPKAEEPAAM